MFVDPIEQSLDMFSNTDPGLATVFAKIHILS